jgi:hypothetical protein
MHHQFVVGGLLLLVTVKDCPLSPQFIVCLLHILMDCMYVTHIYFLFLETGPVSFHSPDFFPFHWGWGGVEWSGVECFAFFQTI